MEASGDLRSFAQEINDSYNKSILAGEGVFSEFSMK